MLTLFYLISSFTLPSQLGKITNYFPTNSGNLQDEEIFLISLPDINSGLYGSKGQGHKFTYSKPRMASKQLPVIVSSVLYSPTPERIMKQNACANKLMVHN